MQVSISHPTDRPNFSRVDVGPLTVWFSYRTPIAFHTYETGQVVRENDWSNTTGKHLNNIDDGTPDAKKARISGAAFEEQLQALLSRMEFDGKADAIA